MNKNKKYIIDKFPELLEEWDYELNKDISPDEVTVGMHKKVFWICKKNPKHRWEAMISNRARVNNPRGCPHCSNAVLSEENCLYNVKPEIAAEFSISYNNGLTAKEVQAGSKTEVFWECSKCNFIYKASICERVKGHKKCPHCTSILYNNPEVMKDWDYEKNKGIDPGIISSGSHKVVSWKCHKCRYEWEASIVERSKNHKTCKGCNSLEMVYPEIAQDWDYKLNRELTPRDVSPNSNKYVFWKCSKNPLHKERKRILERSRYGCSLCSRGRNTSISEVMFFLTIKSQFEDSKNRYNIDNQKDLECDIFIPGLKLGIEYDGYLAHKNKAIEDENKNEQLNRKGIKLIRIREEGLPVIEPYGSYVITTKRNMKNIRETYISLLKLLQGLYNNLDGIVYKIQKLEHLNIEEKRYEALIYLANIDKQRSLQVINPELAEEWHPSKNKGLLPVHVLPNSNEIVWWLCKNCGYEWEASVAKRNVGGGCPLENGRGSALIVTPENSLALFYPELSKELDVEANNGKTASQIYYKSTLTYYWKCRQDTNALCKMKLKKKVKKIDRCKDCSKYGYKI